jgi:homoserine kinase
MAKRRGTPILNFKASPVRVRVPATSANLGPGFDALGLALDWYDDLVAQVIDEPVIEIDLIGEGADTLPRDQKHLVIKAMHAAFDAMGERPEGIALVCANHIPHARGMGSSAAAIVGGIELARNLVVGGHQLLPHAEALKIAATLEGHVDNVAAALLGGLTIAWGDAENAKSLRIKPHPELRPIICIPEGSVNTKKARAALPESISHVDASFNIGRSALLVAALTEEPEYLFEATEDKVHQEARKSVMSKSFKLMNALRDAGHAAVISGSGPSVLVLTTEFVEEKVRDIAGEDFDTQLVKVSLLGAHSVPLSN